MSATYTEIQFTVAPVDPGAEILMAELAGIGYEAFEETPEGLKAYIKSRDYDASLLNALEITKTKGFTVSFTVRNVADENWNQVWESSYDPVLVAGKVYIRASFHPSRTGVDHEILIDPKMSFGTAHHETTAQMIAQMLAEDMAGKRVLDMGCGTAVLAILAERLGAAEVVAIDNDANAVENARENILKNNCTRTSVLLGTAHEITGYFDVILANINKNILLGDVNAYAMHLKVPGIVLMSGFYTTDLEDIKAGSLAAGLRFDRASSQNNWTVARFVK